jgi:hypothetical protein
MKYLTSKAWWAAAGNRALKTVAQTGVALLATQAASGKVDATAIASAALLAGLASLGTSLVGLPELSGQNASA